MFVLVRPMKDYRVDDFVPGGLEGFLPNAFVFTLLAALNPVGAIFAAIAWGLFFGFWIILQILTRVTERKPVWPLTVQSILYLAVLDYLLVLCFR